MAFMHWGSAWGWGWAGLASAALLAASGAGATPVLQVDASGVLIGARSVVVNGTAYDVEFLDGTCASVFGGCDAQSDFMFNSITVGAAVSALLAQVLVDGAQGQFDSDPTLTRGCATTTTYCNVITPYGFGTQSRVNAGAALNWALESQDTTGGTVLGNSSVTGAQFDTGANGQLAWARWSLASAVNPVPEPGTLPLAALSGLLWAALHKRRSSPADR